MLYVVTLGTSSSSSRFPPMAPVFQSTGVAVGPSIPPFNLDSTVPCGALAEWWEIERGGAEAPRRGFNVVWRLPLPGHSFWVWVAQKGKRESKMGEGRVHGCARREVGKGRSMKWRRRAGSFSGSSSKFRGGREGGRVALETGFFTMRRKPAHPGFVDIINEGAPSSATL